MDTRTPRILNGWRLFGILALALSAMTLGIIAAAGFETHGVRAAIAATARTSLALFCLAFAAPALFRLWPAGWSRWLLRNRRYIGVSFAASHALHGVAIIWFAIQAPEQYAAVTNLASYIFGGIGYTSIAVLTLTSFDCTAAAIGPRAWRVLHVASTHYIWFQFIVAFGKRTPDNPNYWWFVAVPVAVMALRITAYLVKRRAAPAQAQASG